MSTFKRRHAPVVIAIVTDCDDTVAPDTTSYLLTRVGIDPAEFWPRIDEMRQGGGWNPVQAYVAELARASREAEKPFLTQKFLAEVGASVKPFHGVTSMFRRLRAFAQELSPDVSLEFYLLSCGFADLLRHMPFAHEYTDIWGNELAYDESGQAWWAKDPMSHPDKASRLFQVERGIVGPDSRSDPYLVHRAVRPNERRIPFSRIIFVGDGMTDVPCISVTQKNGGQAFGVFNLDNPARRAWGLVDDSRFTALLRPDYRDDSDLMVNLRRAIRRAALNAV